ncbi:unnamed protein product, partial [marine sediment metagenome]
MRDFGIQGDDIIDMLNSAEKHSDIKEYQLKMDQYPGGKVLRCAQEFLNKKAHGRRIQWYDNGVKFTDSQWKNDEPHGTSSLWDEME